MLQGGRFEVEDNPFIVTEVRESPEPKTENDQDRTVIVTGVRDPLTLEVLELWLESDKNGGGPIDTISDNVVNGVVIAVFKNPLRKFFFFFGDTCIDIFCPSIRKLLFQNKRFWYTKI